MKKALFYPDPPVRLSGHTLSKVITYFVLNGYELTNDINDDWEIAVHWDVRDINETPKELLGDKRMVLNRNLNDVTKSNVDKIFTEVFGYSSLADTTKLGYCVCKNEKQSTHDGKIIKTPCKKDDGYIYQLLIDNRMSLAMVYDIRIIVFLGKISSLFLKYKSMDGMFENNPPIREVYHTDSIGDFLHDDEVEKILLFSSKIGLDMGEIDALRDNSTGNLYLIDVNNIPGGGVFDDIENGHEVRKQLALFLKKQLDEYT